MYNFKDIIPDNVKEILNLLHNKGHIAYIVGGSCRDYLLGRVPKDFDITTSATPDEILNIFPEGKLVSESFPVVLIKDVEIATFRNDLKDGAVIVKTLEEDINRRDFTINGIIYDSLLDSFIDLVGGIEDLNKRILRFIKDPEKRILEDINRIIRGIRFASLYNLNIEKETYFEMFRLRSLIKDVPKERIQLEIIKAFKSNNTHRFLTMLEEMEMLEYIFPSLVRLRGIDGGDYHRECVLSHVFNALKAIEDKDYRLKLAALYHDVGKCQPEINDKGFNTFKNHDIIGAEIIERDLKGYLKFSNDVVDYVKNLCLTHMIYIDLDSERAIKRVVTKLYEYNVTIKDLIYLRYADSKANSKQKRNFFSKWKIYRRIMEVVLKKPPFSIKDLDIDGTNIMKLLNIKPSRLVGEILRNVFEQVQEDLLLNEKDTIIKYVKENYKGT